MKIMVTGHNGMLGREVVKAVERMGHEVRAEEGVDITDEILVWLKREYAPEVVINCAGLVPQRDPPPTAAEMMRVNGYGPWNLADWCDSIGARLIQVSTDCVFDGSRNGPHSETDTPRPIIPYDNSKLAGEVTGDTHLTIRTSFVGRGKRGLIEELLICHRNNKIYKASNRLLWTGHTTRFVAEALVMLAEREEITGLLHIPGETLTRYELVLLLRDALDLDFGISMELLPDIDRRLESKRWTQEELPDLPSFEWQLQWLRRSA